jgi:alpha,alpha-trehalase
MRQRSWLALPLAMLWACATGSGVPPAPAPVGSGAPVLPLALVTSPSSSIARTVAPAELAPPEELDAIFRYIRASWTTLERNNRQLLAVARDPKFPAASGRWPVYLPAGEDRARIEASLESQMPAGDFAQIEFSSLPAWQKLPIPEPSRPGLLYLPKPYVVPGGRFNEMYGWDSYFILLGLLRDGEVERARGMVDNFVYEIEHYGMILNANRSYYLSRSQPPLLTPMILRVHERLGDRTWLKSTSRAIDRYYAFWTREPHLTPATGLSRYYDLGRGPSQEVLSGEKDQAGRTHYDRVLDWLKTHAVSDYDASRFYDRKRDVLTELYYVADRSMRESGYDPSNRFGPFNAAVIDYDPVCLNSLLYRMEKDAAEIQRVLGDNQAAARWTRRAEARAQAIHRYLWDPEASLFLDYDHGRRVRRVYPFGTTFFPLWVGIASRDQAAKLVNRALRELEAAGGLRTSANRSGNQWDAPYGWAPLEIVAVEGLRAYGFSAEADRITTNFLSLILKEFADHRAIFEKYDVEERRSEVSEGIKFGYSSNEIGFGWTNAAFVTLYDALPEARRVDVRRLAGVPVPSR